MNARSWLQSGGIRTGVDYHAPFRGSLMGSLAVTNSPNGCLIRDPQPLISIIIPTRNSASTLSILLRSVQLQTYSHREVLVIDNGSTDSTIQIARKYRCKVLEAGPERSAQRNTGARAAQGDLFLFLDADMELTLGILEACVQRAREADGLCIREVTVGRTYWARVRAFERLRYFRSDLFEAARCFWRDVFEHLGGYDPALTGLEDYDLHARFHQARFRLGWVETPLLHHEEAVGFCSYLGKRQYYGSTDWIYAAKHPLRWRQQRSLPRRLRCILGKPLRATDLLLLPGLITMRGVEWLLRNSRKGRA
ncbi:MAG: glycosyltransferase family 2 protein [Candidatus Binatia bacterium]